MSLKILTIIVVLVLLSGWASATTVSATVKDINNSLYRNCTGSANFTGQNGVPGSGPYTLNGSTFQTVVPIFCDGSGNFLVSLADNTLVSPTPSQWNFSLCTAIGSFPGPPICFNVLVTISGSTQNATSVIQAAAAILPSSGGGGGGTPASPLNSLQYNNGGSFGGVSVPSVLPAAGSFNSSTGNVGISLLNSTVYVTSDYNWSQAPAGSVSVGANTITVNCPRGILVSYGFTSTPWTEVLVSGAPGAAETPVITATTCTNAGGGSGTITFTAANAHNAGFTVASASQGWQEAINASMQTVVDSAIVQKGHVIGVPGESPWAGKVTVMSSGITIDFSGVTPQCNMSDDCLYIGDPNGQNRVANVTILKYIPRPGVVTGNFAALRTNAQATHIMDMGVQRSLTGATFGSLITADDDESLLVDHLNANPTNGAAYHCGTDFCSVAIKTGLGTAVGWVTNSNLSMNCAANGIDWESGNTLRISNTVIQGFGQFGVRAHGAFSTIPSVELDNVYYEVASCTNPLGIGIAGLAADVNVNIRSSIGPLGKLQMYANTGATQYFYYIVTHSTTGGVSSPMLAGTALTNGAGNITVKWLQIGSTGTITYDVIRTSGTANNPAPYTAVCGGGTPTTCGSVATALTVGAACAAVGSTNICSFVDNAASNTTAYTVSGTVFSPNVWNQNDSGTWPGAVVYGARTDAAAGNNVTTGVYLDNCCDGMANAQSGTNVSQLVSTYGPEMPVFSAQHCSNVSGGLMVICLDAHQGTNNGVTILRNSRYNSVEAANLKGRLLIQNTLNQTISGDLIGLVDTDWLGTLATQGRPTAKAADSAICLDNPAGAVSTTQMCFRSQNMISNYINSLPDNASWLERLTSTLKTFKVPITTNSQVTSTLATGTAPLVISSTTPVPNLTVQNCGATCTITQPVVNTGVSQGSGFKHKRFAGALGGGCPTAAAIGAACTSGALAWATAFADANYTVQCSLVNTMTGQPHVVSITKIAASVTVTIAADTAAAADVAAGGEVDCTAVHD